MSIFAPVASCSLKDISLQRCQLSTTTTPTQPWMQQRDTSWAPRKLPMSSGWYTLDHRVVHLRLNLEDSNSLRASCRIYLPCLQRSSSSRGRIVHVLLLAALQIAPWTAINAEEHEEPARGALARARHCSSSGCWPPCWGHQGLWCSINEWMLRIHSVVGQSVVLAALKQQALKQQAAKPHQPAFRSGRTEKYWHILEKVEQFWAILAICTIYSNLYSNMQY